MSLENFEVIKNQLKDYKIDKSKKVNIFIDSMFQRILKNPEMSIMCAELCKDLFLMSTVSIKNKVREEVISLVNGDSSCVMNDLRLLRSKNNDAMTDARINGFTQLNAEFFKVDLLPANYVHTHMQRLLDLNHICESTVYQASVLLLSCGTKLYNSKFQLSVLQRFVINMENFCQKNKTETEVRMNLKKVLELQQNNWQIIKTTTVKDVIKVQPKDSSSNEVIKSMISLILSDPSSISKCVQDLVKLNDKSHFDLLMIQCKEELEKYLKTVSLHTGKDEILALFYKIQNEEDLKKRKELKMILDCRLDAPKNALLIAKFIAELYNFHLFDNSILVYMEYLLDYEYLNETTTECLCKFLITVGRKLMSDKQRLEIYHKYVKKLGFILNNQAFDMPSHVQNVIEEVIELEVKLMLK